MNITIGAPVIGRSGELGKVRRFLMDRRIDHVEAIIVKEDGPLGKERVVEFHRIDDVREGQMHLNLDQDSLSDLAESPPLGPNPDYVGPPSQDLEGDFQGNLAFDRAVSFGAGGYESGGEPVGYPGGETLVPDSKIPTTVSEGTTVLDCNGDKVGEIGAFSIDSVSGMPTQAVRRQGMFFKQDTELPIAWLQSL